MSRDQLRYRVRKYGLSQRPGGSDEWPAP